MARSPPGRGQPLTGGAIPALAFQVQGATSPVALTRGEP